MRNPVSVFWFRRDLRLEDNAGLYHALRSGQPVLCFFIFDKEILDKLEDKDDRRVDFIYKRIVLLKEKLNALGSDLIAEYNTPQKAWKNMTAEYTITQVYANHDYEPYAIARDENIRKLLQHKSISFHTFKDQCIFEKDEVTKDDGKPYTVFTPYSKKWKARLNDFYLRAYPTKKYFKNFLPLKDPSPLITLNKMDFKETDDRFPPETVPQSIISHYDKTRDIPAVKGTSRLGLHFRFGTISIREKAAKAKSLNNVFLNELIWRDFYMMILYHFPHVQDYSFRKEYDRIEWLNNEKDFDAWCNGRTGYPLVDAGMRELNETGFMHNRVRMVVASFLTKHLLIDWRLGEAYFARKLLDYDLSANNGGWQWAAGCGTDAAPYFRVFNPTLQMQKFDPKLEYVKKWVPELLTPAYPKPVIAHEFARERCLKAYKKALSRD